jgi:hypothetical protein
MNRGRCRTPNRTLAAADFAYQDRPYCWFPFLGFALGSLVGCLLRPREEALRLPNPRWRSSRLCGTFAGPTLSPRRLSTYLPGDALSGPSLMTRIMKPRREFIMTKIG